MKLASVLIAAVSAATLASAAVAGETITYSYDAKGRLVKVVRTTGANPAVTTTYTHDKADNRKNTTTTGSPNSSPPP